MYVVRRIYQSCSSRLKTSGNVYEALEPTLTNDYGNPSSRTKDKTEERISGAADAQWEPTSSAYVDSNASGSSKLLEEIGSSARQNGASVHHERSERSSHGMGKDHFGPKPTPDPHYFGGGFTQSVSDVIAFTFGTAGPAIVFLKVFRDLALKWLANKGSRSVTIKMGTKEITLKGRNDVKAVVAALKQMDARPTISEAFNKNAEAKPLRPRKKARATRSKKTKS